MALERKGYKVCQPVPADSDRIWQFMEEHFNEDEPILRSLKTNENNTWVDRFVRKEIRQNLIEPCLVEPTSIILEDSDGDIAGIKLGHPISIHNLPAPGYWSFNWIRNFPWLVPTKLYQYSYFSEFQSSEEYCNLKPASLLKSLNLENVFMGQMLGVSRGHRRKGLACDMIQRSMELAAKLGCQGYVVESSGIYSQMSYKKHQFQVMKEIFYEDFKDGQGNIVFNDTMEHKSVKMLFKPLS